MSFKLAVRPSFTPVLRFFILGSVNHYNVVLTTVKPSAYKLVNSKRSLKMTSVQYGVGNINQKSITILTLICTHRSVTTERNFVLVTVN